MCGYLIGQVVILDNIIMTGEHDLTFVYCMLYRNKYGILIYSLNLYYMKCIKKLEIDSLQFRMNQTKPSKKYLSYEDHIRIRDTHNGVLGERLSVPALAELYHRSPR